MTNEDLKLKDLLSHSHTHTHTSSTLHARPLTPSRFYKVRSHSRCLHQRALTCNRTGDQTHTAIRRWFFCSICSLSSSTLVFIYMAAKCPCQVLLDIIICFILDGRCSVCCGTTDDDTMKLLFWELYRQILESTVSVSWTTEQLLMTHTGSDQLVDITAGFLSDSPSSRWLSQ